MDAANEPRFAPYVGRQAAALTLDVERGHIRRFVEAVGDNNPIYVDEAAAKARAIRAFRPRRRSPRRCARPIRASASSSTGASSCTASRSTTSRGPFMPAIG